jgi:hypothetical protein
MPEAATQSMYAAPRSFRLDDDSLGILRQLSKKLSISQADVVRLALRRLGEAEKLKKTKAGASAS